jgi:hypothetical protein
MSDPRWRRGLLVAAILVVAFALVAVGVGSLRHGDGGHRNQDSGRSRSRATVETRRRLSLAKRVAPLVLVDQGLAFAVTSGAPPASVAAAAERVAAQARRISVVSIAANAGDMRTLARVTIGLASAISLEARHPSQGRLRAYRVAATRYTHTASVWERTVPLIALTRPLTTLTFPPV